MKIRNQNWYGRGKLKNHKFCLNISTNPDNKIVQEQGNKCVAIEFIFKL